MSALDTVSRSKARHATLKVRNCAAIPDILREMGADPGAVFSEAGVDPALFSSPDNTLTFAVLDTLVSQCVSATGREDFGLQVGVRTGATGIGLAALVSMHAPTVREALQVIAASLRTSDTGGAAILDQRGGQAFFGYVVIAPNIANADQIVDAAIAIIVSLMRSLCGPAWLPSRVRRASASD